MGNYVYVLQDDECKFYIGSTNNLERRLKAHASGNTQTTHRMKNSKLVLAQKYQTLEIARKIERKIKNLKRKDYIEKMVKVGYIGLTI